MPWETESLLYDRESSRILHCADLVTDIRPDRVLELGCSTGVLRRRLKSALPGVFYRGCDISASAIAKIADAVEDELRVCDLNAEGVPFAGMTFDVVVMSGVIEYMQDGEQILRQVRERLRTGGFFVVSYVNDIHAHRLLLQLLGRQPPRHPDWRDIVSPADFERTVLNAGFTLRRRVPSRYYLLRRGAEREWERRFVVRKMREYLPLKGFFGAQFVHLFEAR